MQRLRKAVPLCQRLAAIHSAQASGLQSCAGSALLQTRGIKLFEIFDKEKSKERKQKLKDEMQRGYFDDFKEMRESQGKMFAASSKLIAPQAAPRFPPLEVLQADGSTVAFPPGMTSAQVADPVSRAEARLKAEADGSAATSAGGTLANDESPAEASMRSTQATPSSPEGSAATSETAARSSPAAVPAERHQAVQQGQQSAALLCVAFRAGADDWIHSWTEPFKVHFSGAPAVAVYELSLVESKVMSLWPFRNMIVRSGAKAGAAGGQAAPPMPSTNLFYFGDTDQLRHALQMTNRLTGYIYLLDGEGRVRWRGSGQARGDELDSLLSCTEQLLGESNWSASS